MYRPNQIATKSLILSFYLNIHHMRYINKVPVNVRLSLLVIFIGCSIMNGQTVFSLISKSPNVYDVLNNAAKPLNYNPIINTVSYIQRKSPTYITNPNLPLNAQSGAIVAYIGKGMGSQWDSTLLYADSANWGRFPQGGIYNPFGNTTFSNAYIVGCGSTTNSLTGWSGSWYSSKKINTVGTNTLGPDKQYFSNTNIFNSVNSPNMQKHDRPEFNFTSTNDGYVRTLGLLVNDVNATNEVNYGLRGFALNKGTFVAGQFTWTIDSFIPNVNLKTNGAKQLSSVPYMAWNEAGTIGYVVVIGSRNGATGANIGLQPIIYKTTNSGNSWALLNGIDFNNTSNYSKILNSIDPVNSNSTLKIPCFNVKDGIDLTVDRDNNLHIFTSIKNTKSSHIDSLNITHTYTVNGNPGFSWQFTINKYPYLIDFYTDQFTNWPHKIIDSVGTQNYSGPIPSGPNSQMVFPWCNYTGPNGPYDCFDTYLRLQVSRNKGGDYIVYSWAESDTTVTTNQSKWNEFPDIRTSCLRLCDMQLSYGLNITSNSTKVNNRSYFHYFSPKSAITATAGSQVSILTPMIVSRNEDLDGNLPVNHYFGNCLQKFTFAQSCNEGIIIDYDNLNVQELVSADNLMTIYPMPATEKVYIQTKEEFKKVNSIELFSSDSRQLKSLNHTVKDEHTIEIEFNKTLPGIYLLKITTDNSTIIKKIIIE